MPAPSLKNILMGVLYVFSMIGWIAMLFIVMLYTKTMDQKQPYFRKDDRPIVSTKQKIDSLSAATAQAIAENYNVKVKEIFVKNCYECHSESGRQLLTHGTSTEELGRDALARRAREFMVMTDTFPFDSKNQLVDDFDKIGLSARGLWLTVYHPEGKFSSSEQGTIGLWASENARLVGTDKVQDAQ